MFYALFVEAVMMVTLLSITITLFSVATRVLRWLADTHAFGYPRMTIVFDLAISALWILAVLTSSVWGWAALYIALGLFDTLEPALYFSIASFTTVGYGDIVLEPGWRLLAGMTATHGLLNFGLFTAFLVEIFKRQTRSKRG